MPSYSSRVGARVSLIKSPRFLIGLGVSGIFLGFFLSRAGLQEMANLLLQADYRFVVPAVGFYFLSMAWRTMRWHVMLRPLAQVPVSRLWPILTVGYAANNVLPMRVGDVVRSYYLGERENASKSSVLATVLAERVLDGVMILLLVALVAPYAPVVGLFQGLGDQVRINWLVLTLGLSLPFFFAFGAILLLASRPELGRKLEQALARVLPGRVARAGVGLLMQFVAGLAVLRQPRSMVMVLVLSLPVWLSEMMVYLVLAFSFGINDVFGDWPTLAAAMVLTMATSNLGSSLPASGGGVGSFEFFAQSTLVFFGVGISTASAYALIVHATIMIPITVVGLLNLWLGQFSLLRTGGIPQPSESPREDTPART